MHEIIGQNGQEHHDHHPILTWMRDQVFTTGKAAKILNISQAQVIRLFEAGELSGFVIPTSTHRRIPGKELFAFCAKHKLLDYINVPQNVRDRIASQRTDIRQQVSIIDVPRVG